VELKKKAKVWEAAREKWWKPMHFEKEETWF